MSVSASAAMPATGRHQRRVKNYLLDAHFQLKYTGYLLGIAISCRSRSARFFGR